MPNGETYKRTLDCLKGSANVVAACWGEPGTGKTRCAVEAGITGDYRQVAVLRPPTSFGRGYGYLPGELESKVSVWVQNIKDLYADLGKFPDKHMEDGTLKFPSFEHIQGCTFDHTMFIVDEAENCSLKELKVLMTRCGVGSTVVLCGDTGQTSDNQKNSGFAQVVGMLEKSSSPSMQSFDFTNAKCYRSELCGEVNAMFKENGL